MQSRKNIDGVDTVDGPLEGKFEFFFSVSIVAYNPREGVRGCRHPSTNPISIVRTGTAAT